MIVPWTCVVDDGSRPYGPGIIIDQRRPLRIAVGETLRIEVSLINPEGGVVILGDAEFLVLNARTICLPWRQLFSIRSSPISEFRYALDLSSDSDKNIPAQRGLYDLWAVRQSGRITLIPLSELVISSSALGNNYL